MKRIYQDELFEMLSLWYDEDTDTIFINSESNVVNTSDKSIVHNAGEHLLLYSNHSNGKKIFQNTGTFDPTKNIKENIDIAIEEYRKKMEELQKENERINALLHKLHDLVDCDDCS